MKVKLAKKAGFCMGVKRAMDIVLTLSKDTEGILYTYGPLIHNPQVIDVLKKKNILVADDESSLPENTPIVIRTHGITPEKRKELKEKQFIIKDATCPLVMKVQSIIKRHEIKGYSIIIVGDKGHAEVNGLMGFAKGKGIVINTEEDIKTLPDFDKVCVVTQTTVNAEEFLAIAEKIKKRYTDCVVFNTICDATEKRQSEAIKLCGSVDAMVIVGGKNSANTTRLANICSSSGTPTFFIETEKDLNEKDLLQYSTIGITAGASTPSWMIRRVLSRVEQLTQKDTFFLWKLFFNVYEFLVKSNLYIAFGGVCVTFTACILQQITPRISTFLITLFYLFSMYVLNNFTDQEAAKVTTPGKTDFLKRNRLYFITWGTVALFCSLMIAFGLGKIPFTLLLLSSALGAAYSIKIVPTRLTRLLKYQRLKDIPGSKDIFVSFAWGVVTVLIPLSASSDPHFSSASIAAFFFVFTVVYIRSVLFDIKDIQGDKIVERETIPIIIGKEKTKLFLTVLASLSALLLLAASFFGWFSSLGYLLMISICYIGLYLYLYHRRIISQGISFEAVVDGKFILIGAITKVWLHLT